ncbi:hypothetical protein Bbelb_405060 [Branchiostoma belcheri]|nr:hypothetical protein Bbelb_405060 [Branchiostoma belcheri]
MTVVMLWKFDTRQILSCLPKVVPVSVHTKLTRGFLLAKPVVSLLDTPGHSPLLRTWHNKRRCEQIRNRAFSEDTVQADSQHRPSIYHQRKCGFPASGTTWQLRRQVPVAMSGNLPVRDTSTQDLSITSHRSGRLDNANNGRKEQRIKLFEFVKERLDTSDDSRDELKEGSRRDTFRARKGVCQAASMYMSGVPENGRAVRLGTGPYRQDAERQPSVKIVLKCPQ